MPAMPMALKLTMVVGMRQTSRAISTGTENSVAEMMPNGFRVMQTKRKINVNAESRMVSAISFGVFWRWAPDERDHAVEETFAGIGGDPNLDLIRQHAGAAGHGTAVAAAFPDHGRGDSPVMADSSTVAAPSMTSPSAEIDLPARAITTSSLRRSLALTSSTAAFGDAMGDGLHPRPAQGSVPAPCRVLPRGDGFGEVGEEHGEPQPERELRYEASAYRVVKIPTVVSTAPTRVTNT